MSCQTVLMESIHKSLEELLQNTAPAPKECIESVKTYLSQESVPENLLELTEQLKGPSPLEWLQKRFVGRLTFGTAGLRAVMGVGFTAMNHITVMQTTQGLCEYYIQSMGLETLQKRGVVIGYDGRYNSKFFAEVTAAVFLVKGVKTYLFSTITATPLTPFAVVRYGAACGIQVTASHNPKLDNGYKVYGSNGAQIISPMDGIVSDLILQNLSRWKGIEELIRYKQKSLNRSSPLMKLVVDPLRDIHNSYVEEMSKPVPKLPKTDLKIVYTAMHGVGFPFVHDLLVNRLGFLEDNFYAVPEQRDADPEFATVAFPNPEEKGALDLAMRLAEEVGSPLVIANDPDADRFACAELCKKTNKWHVFHGDELGSIFGHLMMQKANQKGIPKDQQLYICSAVSSRMLSQMATMEGCQFCETLTGFKWMMNKAIEMRDSQSLVTCLAYEEALGYAVNPLACPDKDGVSAAAIWVEAAIDLYSRGSSFLELFTDMRKKYGFFVTQNGYYFCYDPNVALKLIDEFRCGGKYPTHVGKYKLLRVRDVMVSYDSAAEDCKCEFQATPGQNMLTLFFENGATVTIRTSGTEPKLKYYCEMSDSSAESAREKLAEVVEAVKEHIIKPSQYGLIAP